MSNPDYSLYKYFVKMTEDFISRLPGIVQGCFHRVINNETYGTPNTPKDGQLLKFTIMDDEEQIITPLSIMVECVSALYKAMHGLSLFANQIELGKHMQAKISSFIANKEWDANHILDPVYEHPMDFEAAALERELNAASSEGGNVIQGSTMDNSSDLEEELDVASSEGGNVMQDSKMDEASDVAQTLTTTSKLNVAPTARESIFDPTAAAIITGPSFVDAAAAHHGLPTSSSAASHPTSIDGSFNIKINDEQPLPKPPEGTSVDVSEALMMDSNKPNGSNYNCIEDMYDTSKSVLSKALCSTHETYGNGEMDYHLYTDIATMDKPCKSCFQTIIGGAIKIFVDAKGDILHGLQVIEVACSTTSTLMEECIEVSENMDTYACHECLGITTAIVPFNFSTMIPLWSIPMATITSSTLILKPSERVPGISMIIAECCEPAGMPKGVLNLVNSTVDVVNDICDDPRNKDVSCAAAQSRDEVVNRWYSRRKRGLATRRVISRLTTNIPAERPR
ncbi:uncharacterized protein UHO2_00380 [Ustilago hordei]|uniref:uncharacterized protein n=1 Tax=Ustilago hordei TaxID=120017 RepID=UPI001A5A41F2|nr:uncharacterized protein UHO2_00380 [Ustilago hordei]SYW81876.1 uncharacterized protein UHO2_00380 [Ustilago hordei]